MIGFKVPNRDLATGSPQSAAVQERVLGVTPRAVIGRFEAQHLAKESAESLHQEAWVYASTTCIRPVRWSGSRHIGLTKRWF